MLEDLVLKSTFNDQMVAIFSLKSKFNLLENSIYQYCGTNIELIPIFKYIAKI